MPRILIVDDDEAFRRMLKLTLVKFGYDVDEAPNGKKAIALHARAPADLILTDIIMPEQDGLETIPQFRKRHPGVKIVAMSGGGRLSAADVLVIAKLLGADRTLTKPFSNEDLVSALDELLVKK